MAIECFIPLPQGASGNPSYLPCVVQGHRYWTIYNEQDGRTFSIQNLDEIRGAFSEVTFEIQNNLIETDRQAFWAKYPGYHLCLNEYIAVKAPEEFLARHATVPLKLIVRCPVQGPVQRTFFVNCEGPPRLLSREEYQQILSGETNKRKRESESPELVTPRSATSSGSDSGNWFSLESGTGCTSPRAPHIT